MDTKEFVQDSVGRSLTEYKTKYPPVPAEGFDGQVLMKNSDQSGDFIWKSMMGSGWGVAKTGTFTMSGGPTEKVQFKIIDISDLEFAAASDYVVLISNTANSYDNVAITNKTASNFTVRTQYILSDTGSSNGTYGYVIMAKGYGQGNGIPDGGIAGDILVKQSSEDGATAWAAMQSTGWGIVKVVDVTFTNTAQRMYEATVSISELDVTSDDQWAVNFAITGGDEDWGSVGSYTVEKDTPNKQATLKCQYLGVNSSSPKPTTLTAQVVVSADGYGTTLIKEGWGVAKVGRTIVNTNGEGKGSSVAIDVSALGITSADDYTVEFHIIGGTGDWGSGNQWLSTKTASSFSIGAYGAANLRKDFAYTIFAKGFGGGCGSGSGGGGGGFGSEWGVAKIGKTRMTATHTSGWYDITVDITDLNFASSDDYTIQFSVVGGDNDWGKVGDKHVVDKTTSQFIIRCSYDGTGTAPTYVDIDYTIIAKGYGQSLTDWGIARVGSGTTQSGGTYQNFEIDLSDLGFANADDYAVSAMTTGGLSGYGGSTVFYIVEGTKTATGFTLRVDKASGATVNFQYTIFAKGFGSGSGAADAGIHFEVGAERWYGTYTEEGVTYQVYSKIVYIPALPAEAGITNVPHGVTGIKQILAVQGFCSNSMIMNAPRQNVQDNISIYQVQKSGNIAIEVGKDRSSVSAYVTIIYAKNNS